MQLTTSALAVSNTVYTLVSELWLNDEPTKGFYISVIKKYSR